MHKSHFANKLRGLRKGYASLQLDCPSVRHWDLVGPISNPRPVLESSVQTTHTGKVLVFFVKPKNGSFDPLSRFGVLWGGLGTKWAL